MSAQAHPMLSSMDRTAWDTQPPQPAERTGKYRPERRPNYNTGDLMHETDHIGMTMMAFRTVDYRSAPGGGVHGTDRETHPPIWRWQDEPGIWREHSGKIIPIEQLSHVAGIDKELEQRRLLDDRARAAELVEAAFKGGPKPEVIETRNGFELRKSQSGFEVWSSGVEITPRSLPEQIARGIFEQLAGPVDLDPDELPLNKVMSE
jgi:hypothetical protein